MSEPESYNSVLIKLVTLTGQLMLESGAETYRVEDTMERICIAANVTQVDTFATPTGIFVSIRINNTDFLTTVKRVKNRTTNLYKINYANNISRQFANMEIDIFNALDSMEKLQESDNSNYVNIIVSAGFCPAFFALLFGGSVRDALIAIGAGAVIQGLSFLASKVNFPLFLMNMIGGALSAIFGLLFSKIILFGNMDKIIIGSMIPLLPGLAITSAIRDTINGDLLSGIARGVEAILIAISIATGVGIVLRVWFIFTGGISL